LHRRASVDNTYFGAFFVRVLVEPKQPGFVLLNELHQPGHPLALVLELPFLEPVDGNMKMNGPDIAAPRLSGFGSCLRHSPSPVFSFS
jgi:hypothetical protein